MRPKLILDTNIVNTRSISGDLFGNIDNIKAASDTFDIVIPRTVIDEVLKHKKEEYLKQKNALKNNEVAKELGVTIEAIDNAQFSIDERSEISKLPFEIEIIDISNVEECLREMRKLALANLSPFDSSSDKGFNDALIALTIEEYIKDNTDAPAIVFVTNDKRLGERFQDRDDIILADSFEEAANVLDRRSDDEDSAPETTMGSVDEKDKVSNPDKRSLIRRLLTELRNASNFKMVHMAIQNLSRFSSLLLKEDYIDILLSATINNQISWICNDIDVKAFYSDIFSRYGQYLNDNDYNSYVISMNLDKNLIRQKSILSQDDEELPF